MRLSFLGAIKLRKSAPDLLDTLAGVHRHARGADCLDELDSSACSNGGARAIFPTLFSETRLQYVGLVIV